MAPVSEEAFLAACFRHCIDKPKVDFNGLATTIGMSAGGASNRFRAIIKKFEDERGPTWLSSNNNINDPKAAITPTPTPKRKAAKKPTKQVINTIKDEGADGDKHDSGPPKKRAKPSAKKASASASIGVKEKDKKVKAAATSDEDEDSKIDNKDEGLTIKTEE